MFGQSVSRSRIGWESFPGGDRAVTVHQKLGGFLTRAGAKFDTGRVKITVDGLGRDAQAQGDLLTAITFDDIAKAVPLPVAQEGGSGRRYVATFPHRLTLTPVVCVAQPA